MPTCVAIVTGPVVHFPFSYKLISLKKKKRHAERMSQREWILRHLPLKHLTQTKSVTAYKGGLHCFTSAHLCKPMWAAVLCWGSGSSGGNWGRVWFTWQQPLGLFRKKEGRPGTASAAILTHFSMRIKPPAGLK